VFVQFHSKEAKIGIGFMNLSASDYPLGTQDG